MTNIFHHLKMQDDKEYPQCIRLKVDSDDKQKESSTSKGIRLRQVSLQETAKLHILWEKIIP